ncbi:ATP-binding protein [Vulcanisaeta distributa]|uniref:AAA family ATPase n=1 Tax=Vulcanisaeta distributa TaxID=164451 RepID=UPI0006D10DE2|nr:ATP-binding protein [Vulcanisaeta distributa]
MLFSIEPKSRREDLYNFNHELEMLVKFLRGSRLTLVTGLRRTGKTSLMRVALNEAGVDYIYLDVRFSAYTSYRDVLDLFVKALNDLLRRESSIMNKVINALKGIEGLKISLNPPEIAVKFRGKSRVSITDLLIRLNDIGEPVIIAIDEAQELRKVNWLRFDRLFAYVFDNLTNIGLVLSGSQVGLLYSFLGLHDPKAPLFGRAYMEVRTRRLSPDESFDFLERGFNQLGINCPKDVLERAVEAFDGIIGWLTYFGYTYAMRGSADFDEIMKDAVQLALSELRNLVTSLRSNRYSVILRALAREPMPWRLIKRRLEDYEGREINAATVSELLGNLVSLGIIEKADDYYKISDPVYRLAAEYL